MKKIIWMAFAAVALISCNKTETQVENSETAVSSQVKSHEVSNVQDTKIFKNSKGDILKVIYFAEGADVMVKVQKNSEPEQKLQAKTVSQQGNPIFANENIMWEMKEGGAGGKLSDKNGNAMEYVDATQE